MPACAPDAPRGLLLQYVHEGVLRGRLVLRYFDRMLRPLLLSLLVAAVTLAAPSDVSAKRRRIAKENLLAVVTPIHKEAARAHPWINVEVKFGTASNGAAADPMTFKAKLGRCNVTPFFEDVSDGNIVLGKRARLTGERCRLKKGSRPKNRLKFTVRAEGRRLKDRDKIRFGVQETENLAPIADFIADECSGAAAVRFDATGHDPDGDWLTYEWDFGDGTTGTGEAPDPHLYTDTTDITVTLRVSDGPAAQGGTRAEVQKKLRGALTVDPGRTAGRIQLAASPDTSFDFGAVPVGSSQTRSFTIRNIDDVSDTTSQVRVNAAIVDNDGVPGAAYFQLDACSLADPCRLDAGEERPITVTFTPQEPEQHAQAVVRLTAAANNRRCASLVAHGYGGPGPAVPWGTPSTALLDTGRLFTAMRPDGTTVPLELSTGMCQGGALADAPCINDADCPNGTCGPLATQFFTSSYCTDGAGAAFFLNEDAHVDPDQSCDFPCQTGTILRVDVDGARSIVTQKVTEPGDEAPALGCDRAPDGRVYWTDYGVFGRFDDEDRERLKSVKKSGGSIITHVDNVNRRLGDIDPENYIDPTDGFIFYEPSIALHVSANGNQRFVANIFGLYQLDPEPVLITRDVDELFDIGPSGDVVVVTPVARTGEVRVYKIDVNNALAGALVLDDLTPWASTRVPNNNVVCTTEGACQRPVFINDFAVDSEGKVFVNVSTSDQPGTGPHVVPSALLPQGTLRFEPIGDGSSGRFAGFVDLLRLNGFDL